MNQEFITGNADEYSNILLRDFITVKTKMISYQAISYIDWSEMYGASNTQGAFDQFNNTLMELHNKYFPKIIMKRVYSNRKPGISEALQNCMKCKNK